MKASLKFREDQKPLFRAKVPINILGFPFQSGVSAGDSTKELSLNLSTFFDSGPSLKLIYRPNDSFNPFSLVVKTGIGSFGSPISTPLAMSAEFNLVARGNPSFFLQFRPRMGDFSIKKSSGSISAQPSGFLPHIKVDSEGEDSGNGAETALDKGVYKQDNGLFRNNQRVNGFEVGSNAVNAIDRLVNGVELSATTVLPIRNRAVFKCRWGVKFPEEIKSMVMENGNRNPTAAISFRKIPFLVMSKIAIEHVAEDVSKGNTKRDSAVAVFGGNADVAEACFAVRRQLEGLQADNALLKKAVEDLRSEIGIGKSDPVTGSHKSGKYINVGSNGGKYTGGKNERKGSEFGGYAGKITDDHVKEESKNP